MYEFKKNLCTIKFKNIVYTVEFLHNHQTLLHDDDFVHWILNGISTRSILFNNYIVK